MKKLSIGMMVKNEEKILERSLSSIKPILESIESELIIVDTGSSDSTIEIAKKFTNQVYSHEWNNDFSYMRNKVLSYAEGEWFLFLDADEIVIEYKPLVEFLISKDSRKYNSGTIIINNILDGKNPDKFNMFFATRLARLSKDFCFKGKIHEQPQVKPPLKNIDLVVEHYGYDNTDKELMEYKFERSSKILLDAVKEDPDNIYMWYQLSKTYLMHGDSAESLETVEKAFELVQKKKNQEKSVYVYVYSHLARMYISIGNLRKAVDVLEEGLSYKSYVMDLWFYLGKAQINRKKYMEAISAYKKYIEVRKKYQEDENIDITIINGTINRVDEAYHETAFALMKIGSFDEALEYCELINRKYEMYKQIVNIKIKIYVALGNYNEIPLFLVMLQEDETLNKYHEFAVELTEHMVDIARRIKVGVDDNEIVEMKTEDIHQSLNYDKMISSLATYEHPYGILNHVRFSYLNGAIVNKELAIKMLSNLNNVTPKSWWEILDYLWCFEEYKKLIIDSLVNQNNHDLLLAFSSAISSEKVEQNVFDFVDELMNNHNSYDILRVLKAGLFAIVLSLDDINQQDSYKFSYIEKYLIAGIEYVQSKYSNNVLDTLPPLSISNAEDSFLLFYRHAYYLYQNGLYAEYLKTMRKALKTSPEMKMIVQYKINQLDNESKDKDNNRSSGNYTDTEEFLNIKNEFINQIKILIEHEKIDEANSLIFEYEKINSDDADVYSYKGIIELIKNNIANAEKHFLQSLSIDPRNSDTYYNLAYTYELQGKYEEAYSNYSLALINTSDSKLKEDIELKMCEIQNTIPGIELNNYFEKPKITVYSRVYNAEKYIDECINSVLNQTFTDFEYLILDNGCTDSTSEKLQKYALEDSRIKLFRNEENASLLSGKDSKPFQEYFFNLKSEYLCSLDSDDYLHPDFLRELYDFTHDSTADIVICGTKMFKEDMPDHYSYRIPPKFKCQPISLIGDVLPQIYGSLRPLWGKLFRVSVWNQSIDFVKKMKTRTINATDTLITLQVLKNSKNVSSIDKPLHYYRIRKNSIYNSDIREERYYDGVILYDCMSELLKSWNKMSTDNVKFLSDVLFLSLCDIITYSLNSSKDRIERIRVINKLIMDKRVIAVLNENQLYGVLLEKATSAIYTLTDQ